MQTYTPDTITLNSKTDFMITEGLAGNFVRFVCCVIYLMVACRFICAAKSQGITIFSTPLIFGGRTLEKLNAPAYKIASFECIDYL